MAPAERYATLEAQYAAKPYDECAYVAKNTTIADAKAVIHQLIAELRSLRGLRKE